MDDDTVQIAVDIAGSASGLSALLLRPLTAIANRIARATGLRTFPAILLCNDLRDGLYLVEWSDLNKRVAVVQVLSENGDAESALDEFPAFDSTLEGRHSVETEGGTPSEDYSDDVVEAVGGTDDHHGADDAAGNDWGCTPSDFGEDLQPVTRAERSWRIEIKDTGRKWQWRKGRGAARVSRYGGMFGTLSQERKQAYEHNKRIAARRKADAKARRARGGT